MGSVRGIAIMALATGCFYTAPINQRPTATIEGAPSTTLYPKDLVSLQASTSDPDHDHHLTVVWSYYACTAVDACDTDPVQLPAIAQDFTFPIPPLRSDRMTPVQTVLVTADVYDDYQAHALPMPQAVLSVADRGPDVALSASSSYEYVVGTPIDLSAVVGDVDLGGSAVKQVEWTVFPPTSQSDMFADGTVQQDDPNHVTYGKTLVPMGSGTWKVQVVATDPLGSASGSDVQFTVIADPPPCLSQWTPIAPPPGNELPLSQPTLFQVLDVNDDLDPFPPVADPVLGTTTFAWSLLPPGGSAFQRLTATSNSVALDPADYAPGDLLELRVEVYDRNMTPITCADSDPTCSVSSDPSCFGQRLTWDVQVE
jgi:hypothetical protein